MKKTIPFLFPLLFSAAAFCQNSFIISGKVIDAATKLPLQAASVYAQNTTLGTTTDTGGNFKLQLPNGGYDLVVTFTGYQAESRRINTGDAGDNNMVIGIRQKEKELQDVVVKATYEVANGWEQYGDFFLDHFLGKTPNSKQCAIKNREALHFYYYKRRDRLKILATAPLVIVNNALGYTIKYELDSFTHEYSTQLSQYTGYPLFEELSPAGDDQRAEWDAAREVAYKGSILHFMRSFYQKHMKEEGFEIQFLVGDSSLQKAITLKDFYGGMNYVKNDSTQTVDFHPNQLNVAVLYKNELPGRAYLEANPDASPDFELSFLNFLPRETMTIERNGYYYDQHDITITGYLAWEKVGDMLPYDYELK